MQACVNGAANRALEGPLYALLVSLTGSLLVISLILLIYTPTLPQLNNPAPPWWAWTSGIIGGFFVLQVLFLGPKIGFALTFLLALVGQMSFAAPLDHFGALGQEERSVTPLRLLGIFLGYVAAWLMQKAATLPPPPPPDPEDAKNSEKNHPVIPSPNL